MWGADRNLQLHELIRLLGMIASVVSFCDDLSLCVHADATLISIAVAAAKWFDMDWEPFTNMSFLV